MKLERLPEYLGIVVTIIFGTFLALYLGLSAGVGSSMTYMIVGGIIAASVALAMRANIWLLIPIAWPLTGQIVGLPGALPVRDLAILYAFAVFLALKALKVVRVKNQYNWLDFVLFLNLAYLLVIYIKDPIGTNSMNCDRVGGKPYFEILTLVLGYWVIGHVTISAKQAQKFPILMILADLFNGVVGFITFHVPFIGAFVSHFYSGISLPSATSQGNSDGISEEREFYLASVGDKISYCIYSRYSPFTILNPLYFWRFFFAGLAVLAVLKSGFRSEFLNVVLFIAASAYFRHGFWSIARIALVIIPIVGLLIAAQGRGIELPLPMQRTLSFLPGDWDTAMVIDAEASAEWRYVIWRNVWNSGHKYIDNWWFGDGFGMTQAQFREMINSRDCQENAAINGDYHSLPLSAIRTVGYVGFSFFCILLFATAAYSWKLIRLATGTPFFSVALFMGVPAIVTPLPELCLTGFFDYSYETCIFTIAMMRMVGRSLEKYQLEQKQSIVESEKPLPELVFHRFQSETGPV